MLKGMLKIGLSLAFILFFLAINSPAQILSLTDENVIGLNLDRLKKSIQKTDTLQVFEILGTQVSIKGEIVDPRSQVRSIFEKAGNRKLSISPPSEAGNGKFWDLEFTDCDLIFDKETTTAVITCKLKLWAAKTDIPRKIRQTSESFRFRKIDKEWRLVGFDNLLDFLWGEVNSGE